MGCCCCCIVSGDAASAVGDDVEDGGNQVQPACMTAPGHVEREGSTHRYHYEPTTNNYDEAQAACAASGAHLVVINDAEENDFVSAFDGDPWLGYDDQEVEGSFAWVNGDPTGFEAWNGSAEPNDNGGREDCTRMQGSALRTTD